MMKPSLDKIRLKKQRHRRSCGLACVAMIASVPYNKVVEDFEKMLGTVYLNWSDRRKRWILGYGTSTTNLHALLKKYGITSNKKQVSYNGTERLPELTILTVDKRQEKNGGRTNTCWHWVVSVKRDGAFVIYDPLDGERRLKDVAPVDSYIRIHT